jgi:hypothetical protein
MEDRLQVTGDSSQNAPDGKLNDGQIDELLRIFRQKTKQRLSRKCTVYTLAVAQEVVDALTELQSVRKGIRVEGTVS